VRAKRVSGAALHPKVIKQVLEPIEEGSQIAAPRIKTINAVIIGKPQIYRSMWDRSFPHGLPKPTVFGTALNEDCESAITTRVCGINSRDFGTPTHGGRCCASHFDVPLSVALACTHLRFRLAPFSGTDWSTLGDQSRVMTSWRPVNILCGIAFGSGHPIV
jgi:hypothetical protein